MRYKSALAALLLAVMLLTSAAQAEASYYVDVDIANQIVTVYDEEIKRTQENIVRQMICSTGYGTLTPTGDFIMPEPKYESERQEWYWFGKYKIYAKYASRVVNGILFHSVLFPTTYSQPTWASTHALGYKASHGCIRLRVEDAKWIAENCLPGTNVHIFSDGEVDEDLRQLLMNSSFAADELSYDDFLRGMCTLSRGSRFSTVTKLQEKLIESGYLDDRADGIFGSRTEKAVMGWQSACGLEPTGIVTPAQLDALLSGRKPVAEATATPEPTATADAGVNGEPIAVDEPIAATPTPTPEPTATATPTPIPEPTATATPTPTSEPTATPEPTPSPTPDISEIPGTVALVRVEKWLNLRQKPDVSAPVLAQLTEGMAVQVLHNGAEWSQVIWNGKTGWVGSKYIEIVRSENPTEE